MDDNPSKALVKKTMTTDKITRLKWFIRVITRVIFYFHKTSIIQKASANALAFFCCYETPRTKEVEGAHQSKKKKIAVVLCHRGHVMKKVYEVGCLSLQKILYQSNRK